ncbi:MAG: sigma-70 family RNA polymerase sigma factor [Ilumatobacter sp.]|uniref:RNA polymerase sigma factor n=1 Tax=Ilumatobacter sp. TaxID=1967498 RepID=UPI003C725C2A
MPARLSPVDHAHRTEWAPLVATLLRETRSLQLAEDSVSEAFVEASVRWRTDGPPQRPGAWLLTTARRKAIDQIRRQRRFDDRLPQLAAELEDPPERGRERLGDDQLALIAGCAHPALDAEAQVALTLRYVCGLTTEQIARSFMVPNETMKKRLTRAKAKISAAGVPFTVPEHDRLPERLTAVCGVVYAVFNEGYASSVGPELVRGSLCDEAIWLCELLCDLAPDDGEVHGLAGLILLTDSRRWARTDADGLPVLLEDQDRSTWDTSKIERGLRHLSNSASCDRIGPYRLMGSIAGLHARSPSVDETPFARIAGLYGALIGLHDSPVLRLNQAAALAWSEGPATGLALIDELADQLDDYSYFHSSRAALLAKLDRGDEAVIAYDRSIALTRNEAEIRWMTRQRCALSDGHLDGPSQIGLGHE